MKMHIALAMVAAVLFNSPVLAKSAFEKARDFYLSGTPATADDIKSGKYSGFTIGKTDGSPDVMHLCVQVFDDLVYGPSVGIAFARKTENCDDLHIRYILVPSDSGQLTWHSPAKFSYEGPAWMTAVKVERAHNGKRRLFWAIRQLTGFPPRDNKPVNSYALENYFYFEVGL